MFIQLEYYGCEIGFCNVIFDTTAQSVLLANEEHGFFRLYFFTSNLVDLEQILREVDFPGDVVAGYVTRVAVAAFQQSDSTRSLQETPITCPRKTASALHRKSMGHRQSPGGPDCRRSMFPSLRAGG